MNRKSTYPSDGFVGRGHVFADIAKESLKTRLKTERANEIEMERLLRMNKSMEREQRMREAVLERMKARTEKHLGDLTGYRRVLNTEYKVSNFSTMKKGFRRKYVYSPRTARRLKLETRIYHGGYQMNYFQPEIQRKLRNVDPTTMNKLFKKVLKELNEEGSGEVIDRNLTDNDYYEKLKEKTEKAKICHLPKICDKSHNDHHAAKVEATKTKT
ncbi:hypothetical protein FSP39_001390 [Pinctada imbricata]|uniref:Uncharacterized protein n=1 Tax=Pinctada imbricata TaxID=66713 RepID=A0AA88XKH4_PINIB|nr:hypothetical protein FSP39_001390 [Pinctada imbricata]